MNLAPSLLYQSFVLFLGFLSTCHSHAMLMGPQFLIHLQLCFAVPCVIVVFLQSRLGNSLTWNALFLSLQIMRLHLIILIGRYVLVLWTYYPLGLEEFKCFVTRKYRFHITNQVHVSCQFVVLSVILLCIEILSILLYD